MKFHHIISSFYDIHTFDNVILCNIFICRTSEKRVSAVAISNDDLYVTFADKFGVVWLVTLGEDGTEQVSVDNKPVSILGHYCSIITSMVWTSLKFYITCDIDLYLLLAPTKCVTRWCYQLLLSCPVQLIMIMSFAWDCRSFRQMGGSLLLLIGTSKYEYDFCSLHWLHQWSIISDLFSYQLQLIL